MAHKLVGAQVCVEIKTEISVKSKINPFAIKNPDRYTETSAPSVLRTVVASPPPKKPPAEIQIPGSTDRAAKLVAMTPDLAAHLLDRADGNRRLRPKYIKQLAADIVSGHWRRTTDAIGIRTDGRVGNAQHRLHAVMLASDILKDQGKPWPDNIYMYVVEGLTDEEFMVIDTGIKRSAADALHVTPTQAADATLIGHLLGRSSLARVKVDTIQDILHWWLPLHEKLSSTHVVGSLGTRNASIRVGVGVRAAIQTNDGDKAYVLEQYCAFLKGDVQAMSRAVANLWKIQARSGGFHGTIEQRVSLTLLAYRAFDPKRKDVVPAVGDRNRQSVTDEIRKDLLSLELADGGSPPEEIKLSHAIPMTPARRKQTPRDDRLQARA
jgi:hypothetical protein